VNVSTIPQGHTIPKVQAEAHRLLAAGVSVLPIKPDGSKAPALASWKPYRSRQPTSDELHRWFQHRPLGLGIISGSVSGSLEILDFDAPETFAPWSTLVEDLASGLLARLPQVETPSGGRHVYYRCLTIAGNLKLAQRLTGEGRPETLIETRGEGGYVIAPPSPPACHPLNRPYSILRGDLAAIPTVNSDERMILLNSARSFNKYLEPERVVSGHSSSMSSPAKGDRPGDVFNACAAWSEILAPHGWTPVGHHGEITLWRRPGKRGRGISATTNYAGSDVLYVFSTNAWPFEPETPYRKFAAYALLAHGGDFTAAARALGAMGYGERVQRPTATMSTNGGSGSSLWEGMTTLPLRPYTGYRGYRGLSRG
jgi:hypothetical protein